jgi:hypothetical protein
MIFWSPRPLAAGPVGPDAGAGGQPARGRRGDRSPVDSEDVKKILELLVCFLHPVAVILVWINLATRRDIGTLAKVACAVFALIPLVPFLYVLTGGDLW